MDIAVRCAECECAPEECGMNGQYDKGIRSCPNCKVDSCCCISLHLTENKNQCCDDTSCKRVDLLSSGRSTSPVFPHKKALRGFGLWRFFQRIQQPGIKVIIRSLKPLVVTWQTSKASEVRSTFDTNDIFDKKIDAETQKMTAGNGDVSTNENLSIICAVLSQLHQKPQTVISNIIFQPDVSDVRLNLGVVRANIGDNLAYRGKKGYVQL
jgi:hypothetical protein